MYKENLHGAFRAIGIGVQMGEMECLIALLFPVRIFKRWSEGKVVESIFMLSPLN